MSMVLGNLAPVMKHMLLYIQPFGIASLLCDGIFVHKSKTDASRKVVEEKSDSLKEKKASYLYQFVTHKLTKNIFQRNMIIFAEGTRSDKEQLLPFKKGAFYMSIQSGMRILPVVVQRYPFLDHKNKIFGRGEVAVKILPPMEKFDDENINFFTQRVYEVMNSEYQQLNRYVNE